MIPIKINNKSFKIKSINELNTAEFIELSKIGELDYVKYISWQTGVSINDAFFAVVSKGVEKAIGVIPDIRKLPRHKMFNYNKTIQTVGQRYQVEEAKLTNYDLLVFVLAVAQAESNNIDKVYQYRDAYLKMSFIDIMPAAFFFFQEFTTWQQTRGNLFRDKKHIDKDIAIKKRAGLDNLSAYTNYYELSTLCEILNCDFETILNSDDTFCTKVLLSNLEKSKFTEIYHELKFPKKK